MKQNSIFSYLSKIVKSDVKEPNKSETKPSTLKPNEQILQKNKVEEKPENLKSPESKQKSAEKPKTLKKKTIESKKKERHESQKKNEDEMQIEEEEVPKQSRKRLKKVKDIENDEEKLIKLPPKKQPEPKMDLEEEEEKYQKEVKEIIKNLDENELAANLDHFKFTKHTPKINEYISTMKPKPAKEFIAPVIANISKYIINENSNKTEILTEELSSHSSDDEKFFEQFNKNKNPSQKNPTQTPIQTHSTPKKPNPAPPPQLIISQKKEITPPKPPQPQLVFHKKEEKKEGSIPIDSEPSKKKPHFYGFNKPKTPKKATETALIGPLSKLTVVLTGVLQAGDRDSIDNMLKSLGARVTGSISGKTDYLIAGDKLEDGRPGTESSKYKKAKDIKTKILHEGEFENFIFEKTGKTVGEHVFPSTTTSASILKEQKEIEPEKMVAETSAKKDDKTKFTPIFKSETKNAEISDEFKLWTHKYAPRNFSDLIGNNENVKKIQTWLQDWNSVVLKGLKKESKFLPGKGSSWSNIVNLNAKACLISGPPGIGKTTAVRVLCKVMGYELIEKNASDVRNKNAINFLLGDLKNNNLIGGRKNEPDEKIIRKFLILMDEVDGMSSDRGGSTALIEIIKNTKIPIICICNDRSHPKMRTLSNHCYDIKFTKPNKQIIARKLVEVCSKENLAVEMNALEFMCESLGNDIRQILNMLQMWKRRNSNTLRYQDMNQTINTLKKDDTVMLSNFDACAKLLNARDSRKLSFRDKMDLFFIDYDLIPLLIQENYLSSGNEAPFDQIVKASESIATGDIVSTSIRRNNDWGLMPNLGLASSLYPGHLCGNFLNFPKFPEWLGKNSSQRKVIREIKEIKIYLSSVVSADRFAVKFDYSSILLKEIVYLLRENLVDSCLEFMEHYNITPEVLKENLVDIQFNPKKIDFFAGITTATKSSLTKLYNKAHKETFKGKKSKKISDENNERGIRNILGEEDGKNDWEEEEENKEEEEGEAEKEIMAAAVIKTKGKKAGTITTVSKKGKEKTKK